MRKREIRAKIFGKKHCSEPVEKPITSSVNVSQEIDPLLIDNAAHLNEVANNTLITAARSTNFQSGGVQNCYIFFVNQPVQDLTSLLREWKVPFLFSVSVSTAL